MLKDVCILSFHFLDKDFSERHFEKKKKRLRTAFRIPTWNGQILRRLSDILAGGRLWCTYVKITIIWTQERFLKILF